MARFGDTLIDVETIEQSRDLGQHLEAMHDLARLAQLATWGLRWAECHEKESCGGPLRGDDELVDSLLWPPQWIAQSVSKLHREAAEGKLHPVGGA